MKRGQFTIVALVAVLITLIVYGALYPLIAAQIALLIPQVDGTTGMVLNLIPFFIAVAIVLTVVFYALPQQQQQG